MMFVVACWGELERFRGRVGIGLRFEQRTSNGAMGFFTVMVVVGAIAAVSQLSFQLIYARYLEVRLETRLGFEAQTTFVRRDPGKQSRLWQLRLLRNGSPLAQAGAKLGDVIVTDLSPNEFLRALDQNRGSTMDITLATAVPSLAIDERPQRTVTLDLTKH
jgi:hypothetical protein